MTAAARAAIPGERLAALDVARGLAVLGMIWLHLVATDGARSGLERAAAATASALYGKPAALFSVLAGVSWAIQAGRHGGRPGFAAYVLRRAAALAALGLLLAATVWPTEILTPLALMMPLVVAAARAGTGALGAGLALVLVAMPLCHAWWGDYAWSDWHDDGSHRAATAFGWITLRYYLYTGNYPLVGWLAFPLCGALAVRLGLLARRGARTLLLTALPVAALAILVDELLATWAAPGALAPHLLASWVPTSIPFVLIGASASLAVVALALAAGARARWLAALGRASLTHYVLHVLVVFAPLRLRWPDEDWPIAVGAAAFALYAAAAAPLSVWWFRHRRRGPLEALWRRASGRPES